MAGSTAAALFLDTSAVVRRYHRTEPGAARVRALCLPARGNRLILSRAAGVEVTSAFNRLLREGRIDRAYRDRNWRLFRRHLRHQYHVIALDERIYQRAEELLFVHPLRAYDALQLAAALIAARLIGNLAPFRFCTADRAQGQAARGEGELSLEHQSVHHGHRGWRQGHLHAARAHERHQRAR